MSSEHFQKLANSKFDIKAAKLALLERVNSQLTFTYNNGLFKATPNLLAQIAGFQQALPYAGTTLVMLDEYDNPIEVKLSELQKVALEANQYALNAYLNAYNKLKKVRKGDKL